MTPEELDDAKLIAARKEAESQEPWWRTSQRCKKDSHRTTWQWRLWLRGKSLPAVKTEVSIPYSSRSFSLHIDIGEEERQLSFTAYCPWIFATIGFNYLPIPKWVTHRKETKSWDGSDLPEARQYWVGKDRTIGITVYGGEESLAHFADWYIWISLWKDQMGWSSSQPWWWEVSINPVDWIFGKTQYESKNIITQDAVAEVPGGDEYPVAVKINQDTWTRPRWPWSLTLFRADVDVPEGSDGIPTGEEKFGMPSDRMGACFTLADDGTCPLNPVQVALDKFCQGIMEDRNRYGYKKEGN